MKKENKLTRDDAEDFLQSKGVFNHPYITFGDKENSMELADLMVEFANKYSQVKPFEPKDGDILFHKETDTHHESISIYKNKHRSYCMWINITDELEFNPIIGSGYHNYHISEATEAQKQLLFDRLAKDGKKWNPETKQLEDRNEPKVGDLCIFWDDDEDNYHISMLVGIGTFSNYRFESSNTLTNHCIIWDGTKEQFDRIRKGGNK